MSDGQTHAKRIERAPRINAAEDFRSETFLADDDYYFGVGDEARYRLHYSPGLTSGGTVFLVRENRVAEGGVVTWKQEGPGLEVHKNAIVAFVAQLVRQHKAKEAEESGDLQVLGL